MVHSNKHFDPDQQIVISANGGYYLVLAPPGCGKTELLTHRIIHAHTELGVNYSDMLCLTFTNRAARGMRDRIKENAPEASEDLYVGNIHRFCSRFLYENQVIPMSTGIIDELDQKDILDEFGFTKYNETHKGFDNQLHLNDIGRLASRIYQEEHNHPEEDWLDLPKFKSPIVEMKSREMAKKYYDYKRTYNVIDFDDILLLSYSRMLESNYKDLLYSNYHWIQIDEVQDLNNLQFAIIDKLTAKEGFTVMYLGDEQQAIYSFMGAKLNYLNKLAQRAGDNILRLYTNYRSPKYLLDAFNSYAINQLGMAEHLLPQPNNNEEASKGMMSIFKYPWIYDQDCGLVRIIKTVTQKFPDERIGVFVRTNKAADRISRVLNEESIKHFKISGEDVFKSDDYKTLVAHFSVVQQDTNFLEWARILWKLRATYSFKDARAIVTRLRKAAITPSDFIDYTDNATYITEFLKTYSNKEFVIFDTETTGLNIFEDDVIQIAAFKVKHGEIVPGSNFSVLIKTEREIPLMLGKEINPMVEVYKKGPLCDANYAIRSFLEYVGDDEILGHNVNFDYQILRYNMLRRLNGQRIDEHIRVCWDSLKLIRLLEPHLRVYKLKSLLSVLGLEGQNTHRADDDIMATKSVVDYCVKRIINKLPLHEELWRDINIQNAAIQIKAKYSALFTQTRRALYEEKRSVILNPFLDEFDSVYNFLINQGDIKPIPGYDYIISFFQRNVFNERSTLWEQVNSHLSDLKTYSQSDLCESDIIKEKVYLMTVHKAKGLEFEHVILCDAVDGTYPFFSSHNGKEEARVFYVGLSRAKKRISVLYYTKIDTGFQMIEKSLTPFMHCIFDRFMLYQQ